jgi:ADP-dependent NAD(P)H-hydrate dehydratase
MSSHEATTVTPAVLRAWPLPPPGQDKESRGRTLVVGGSNQTPGAVQLAGEAALRSGAGKLQVATVGSLAPQVAAALPEALVRPLAERPDGDIDVAAADVIVEMAQRCAAVLLGPGVLQPENAERLLAAVLPGLDTKVVIDAVALAYVGRQPEGLQRLGGRVVLTPNTRELALTLGADRTEVEQDLAGAAARLASATGAVVSAGAATTWTATPDGRLWKDEVGGPGLGLSGSGDVKAGVVVGLCARGARAAQAAVWGAYLHARAGDRLAGDVGPVGFLARELPPEVPRVLREIEV